MTRYDDTSTRGLVTPAILVALFGSLVCLYALTFSVWVRSIESTNRLGVHSASLTRLNAEVHRLRARILRLERPDEPVYPPRNPGRIGGAIDDIPWIEPWSRDPSIGSSSPVGTSIDRQ